MVKLGKDVVVVAVGSSVVVVVVAGDAHLMRRWNAVALEEICESIDAMMKKSDGNEDGLAISAHDHGSDLL